MMDIDNTVRTLIAKSCVALDSNDYKMYLELCTEDFEYKITAFSPEIRKDMLWLEKNRYELKNLFDLLPKQNMDRTPLIRHFSLFTVEPGKRDGVVNVTSALQVYRTEHLGGDTSLVAVGKYFDEIQLGDGRALLSKREVSLSTRMLGKGYHVPF